MKLTLLAGTANPPLSGAVAAALGTSVGACAVTRFPDGEIGVALGESVRDHRVCLLQPTAPPVDSSLLELLLLADACRRDGASSITAVVPYFGYARQDRRTGRSAIGGRAVAAMIESAGIDRVVAVDLHSASVEGFFDIPVEHLSAVPLLAERLRGSLIENSVIVAPDLGAAKLAARYASILGLPVAIVQKKRVSGTAVTVHGILGDVEGRARDRR
jgi:ribose-phosphate pyrophosphokinase